MKAKTDELQTRLEEVMVAIATVTQEATGTFAQPGTRTWRRLVERRASLEAERLLLRDVLEQQPD